MSTLEFTKDEIQKIQKLRTRLSAELATTRKYYNDNAFLIRWLRARNMNVDRAEEMLRKSLQWRQTNNVDAILLEREEIPDKYKLLLPCSYLGMEPETGCPIYLFLFGRYDIRSIVEEAGLEMALRFDIIILELIQNQMRENAKKVGKPVTGSIELMDLEGFSLRQMGTRESREAIQKMARLFEDNYPEGVKTIVILNAPTVFAFAFNMLKPFIPKNTLEKIEILGTDRAKWIEAISKKVPMELVPKHWGGTLRGNDEYCSNSEIWILGPLGPNFFSKADEDGFIKTRVNARDKFHIEFDVEEPNVLLEWKFKTDDHDISFAFSKDGTDLIPLKRVDSHIEVQEGRHNCETTGSYQLMFDNTYSYTRAKILYHKIEVTTAESSCLEDK